MISLGIDQSYTNFGIAVVKGKDIEHAKILSYNSFNFKGMKTKIEKRLFVRKLIKHAIKKFEPDIIVLERIRVFSQGYLGINYIKATAPLIATVVDTSYPQKVYSVDTRSWKSKVCGKASGMHKADKGVSVRYINNRFGVLMNDDQADAVCIALYGLEKDKNKKLFKEET